MLKSFFLITFLGFLCVTGFAKTKTIKANDEAIRAVTTLQPGDTLMFKNGSYKDIKLILTENGTRKQPIVLMSQTPGKVIICGDSKVEMRGSYTELNGFYFTNGNRNPDEWNSHGPGLVAIYASYCRVSNCAFNNFDEANSAYITTSLDEKGNVPTHCRIDHCSFTNKLTFDQVINLNNRAKPDKSNPVIAPAMYHRVDHCFFSNPKKKGNAGGGIRIGYYRNDLGRCLVDSNIFIRQDSEAEIITSKSMENVYFANTFINCQGTLNFRHGDKQVAINNYFLSNDEKYNGYGGMFVWGSNHIIAGNYFSLSKTIQSRGNAALYLNPGSAGTEHALAFGSIIANNIFANNNGYAVHFNPMEELRRKQNNEDNTVFELPHSFVLSGNIFWNKDDKDYAFFKDDHQHVNRENTWVNNIYWGSETGLKKIAGLEKKQAMMQLKEGFYFLANDVVSNSVVGLSGYYNSIEGIPLDFDNAIQNGSMKQPLTLEQILPLWMSGTIGDYYKTGKLTTELTERLKRITASRLNEN